ncbi:MAG TPA: BatD family protein [Bacteroidales bacterium]|nr:BatD family protein [Bacteroidales bacterium]
MGKLYRIFIVLLIVHFRLAAQDIYIRTDYPKVVNLGEQFTISWTINAAGGEFIAPSITGFYVLMGPQTSYSSSTQIINGKISREVSYTYTYYLQAINEGKFVIPPAIIKIKNKEYISDSIYIEVISSAAARQIQPGTTKPQGNQSVDNLQTTGGDLYVRLIPNKTEVFVGEPLTVALKIFSRTDLAGLEEVKYPDFKGFIKEDIETPPLTALQRENINGVIYGTGIIQQFLLFPQITGEVTIEPVQITALVQQRMSEPDPFFGDFFSRFINTPRVLATLPLKIKVKPLPEGKPEDFSGVVGNVKISATLDKDTVNVNDALNFKITISGTGNIKFASKPVLKLSPDIEIYDPKITDNFKNSPSGTTGQKTFEYVLIPRHHGDFIVPSITYSYFNPSTKKYERVSTNEFRFHALKGTEKSGEVTMYGGVTKEDVKYLGKDIRFIKSVPGTWIKSDKFIATSRIFPYIYLVALLLFVFVLVIRREHVRRNADIARVRNRKAGKIAKKRLRFAEQYLKSGDNEKFYEELHKALWSYLSDKLSIPFAEINREKIIELLKEKGFDENQVEQIKNLIDKCEFARFAPAAPPAEAAEIFKEATRIIKSVENKLG